MRAMILAAGRGTRLRPRTDTTPKILVPVCGIPMLGRLRAWLQRGGVTALAMNTHHLPETVDTYLASHPHELTPRLFHEPELLGTGGALRHAQAFWGDEPLLVWNGDILADVDPRALMDAHRARSGKPSAIATLVVQERGGDSHLLVDADGRICGLDSKRRGQRVVIGSPREPLRALGFNGISVLEPALLAHMPDGGPFDLIDSLLAAIRAGAVVRAHDAGRAFYGTTGSPEQLAALERGLGERPALLAAWTP